MKIRKVKCEQFAGIIDREIEFKDGMNLFIGENETGKSTIADLIFYLFFGDVKLSAKSDREFLENYFPKLAGGDVCEEIDGEISFETKNGAYTLSKTWDSRRGKVGSCKLKKKGENSKTDPQQIAKILSEELGYGAGVYSELVLPSQKRQQAAVESILKELSGRRNDKLEETKGELASTLKKAVLESGGVSLDKLSEKLSEKLFSYESHWDLSAGMPEGGVKRGIENPWKKEVGLILEAYYKMETVR
ncbi:MAG: AAA family ATPase, partial [Lachnospiraceae bacterium]|nr:AAA family ATPase [Lachnospiraceae bacterium]